MSEQDDLKRGREILMKEFGAHEKFILYQLQQVALGSIRCDITVFRGKPRIDVKITPTFLYALMYGAGPKKMAELLSVIPLSDGTTISFNEIWTINPMPNEGFTKAELDAVDLSQAEKVSGPNGESLRKMISKSYRCNSREEEDKYLRRFIAS